MERGAQGSGRVKGLERQGIGVEKGREQFHKVVLAVGLSDSRPPINIL